MQEYEPRMPCYIRALMIRSWSTQKEIWLTQLVDNSSPKFN